MNDYVSRIHLIEETPDGDHVLYRRPGSHETARHSPSRFISYRTSPDHQLLEPTNPSSQPSIANEWLFSDTEIRHRPVSAA
jgi:hypothetical protein